MKKIISVVIICTLLLSYTGFASENRPLKRLGQGLNNIVYGAIELPDTVNETNSKGTKAFAHATDRTKDDVGRAIARIVGGLFQIAFFWYPED